MAGNGVGLSEGGWKSGGNVDFNGNKANFTQQRNIPPVQKTTVVLDIRTFHENAPWNKSTDPFSGLDL